MENTNLVVVINPACEELTNKIKGSMYNVAKEFVYIGFLLAECEYYESYKEWGYSSIHEYASVQLGFKKSSTYNFINVCKTFCNPTQALPFSYFMKDTYTEFNYSQLVEMLSMNDKQCSQVTPDMTVKQIREVKKSFAEPEYAKLYNMQLKFEEFLEVYSRKINGKKFTLKIAGCKCEPSDIWPDGYYVSVQADLYMNCGYGSAYNRIVDYEKFKEFIFNQWHRYDKFDDSRYLESTSAPEAPAPVADLDYVVPKESDLRILFDDIESALLFNEVYEGQDLYDVVVDFFHNNGYVILKKVK